MEKGRIDSRFARVRSLLAIVVVLCAGRTIGASTITFEPGDLSQFSFTGDAASRYSIGATAGVGGGSGLLIFGEGAGGAYLPATFKFSLNEFDTISIDFHQNPEIPPLGGDVALGFYTDPTGTDLVRPRNSVTAYSYPHPTIPMAQVIDCSVRDNGLSTGGSSWSTWAPNGNWWRLQLRATYQPNTIGPPGPAQYQWALEKSLWDLGVDGTSTPLLRRAGTQTSTLYGDVLRNSTIYAGFMGYGNALGYDNLVINATNAPEPGTVAFLALVGTFHAVRRRRSPARGR